LCYGGLSLLAVLLVTVTRRNGRFSFHINKDKGLEAYGGPNFSLPNPIPSRTVGKLIGPHDRGIKYLVQADLRKADWWLLPLAASHSPAED